MGDFDVERARQLVSSGKLSPATRQALEGRIRAASGGGQVRDELLRIEPGGSEPDVRVDIGEARILDEADDTTMPGPGGSVGGGSPYDELAPQLPTRAPASAPGEQAAAPSRADDVLGYLRAGLHGMDRSVSLGAGTALGEMVDPGTRARGEEAAAEHPVSEIAGMVGGALLPGAANRIGKGATLLAGGAVKGAGALAKIARGALAGAGSGAAQDVGEDVVAGRPVEGAGRAATVGGLLGGALAGIGAAATGIRNAIRDPMEQRGRDIASAEAIGGATDWLKGMKKGPVYEEAEAAARKATDAREVISPAGVAQAKAVPKLGAAVQSDIKSRLKSMGGENAQIGDDMVSLQPLVDRALGNLNRIMHDRRPLGGMEDSARELAEQVKANSNISIVDVTDEAVERAAAESVMMADDAAAMGLIAKGRDLANKAVIITPRWIPGNKLEIQRGNYFKSAGDLNVRAEGLKKIDREMGGAAIEARAQLGQEAVERAARHEKSLGEMENVINAAGLPQGTRKVNVGDLDTRRRLAGALGSYRTGANEGAGVDKVLNELAGTGPLRGALNESAGVAAIQRLRKEGAVPLSPGGIGNYGFKDAAALRADDVLRYLGRGVDAASGNGVIPAISAQPTVTRRKQR